jgi:membrane protein YqaA with SNARE-associated domain
MKGGFLMSDHVNLYQSPQSPVIPEPDTGTRLTSAMTRHLKEASPWLRFIGILSFIGSGFMFLGGIVFLVTMDSLTGSNAGGFARLGGGIGSVVYIVSGVLMLFPARFIYNFGAKIRNYLQSNSEDDLEQALKNNKSLWKFTGILSIVCLAMVPVGIVIVVLAGIGASLL